MRSETFRQVQNSDGVALPIALLSLVAVTILVTSVLLSSSTEVVLSSAHQDATRGLFNAEGAIEAYVAAQGAALTPATTNYTPPGGSEVELSVTRLASVPSSDAAFSSDPSLNDITYAVTATPRRGGRRVTALIKRVTHRFNVTINAGLLSGDNVSVSGGAKLSDGSDSPIDPGTGQQLCTDTDGAKAVQLTSNSNGTVSTSGGGTIVGAVETLNVQTKDIVQSTFGRTLQQLIDGADIKLNSRDFKDGKVVTHNVGKVTSLLGQGATPMQNTPLNWGCPADIFADCRLPTYRDADTTRLPVIAIDAGSTACDRKNTNCSSVWNTAIVDMSHGQGILIVYNGNFHIAGQFAFKGVILVEGSFTIDGRGGDAVNAPKIEGAVIGLGLNAQGQQSTVSDNSAAGNATVRYNRCAINLVTQQTTRAVPDPRLEGRTFGWFEVVR
jgi:hypothetical protein